MSNTKAASAATNCSVSVGSSVLRADRPRLKFQRCFGTFSLYFRNRSAKALRACPHTFPVSAKARGLGGWFEDRPLVFGVLPVTIGASRWRNEGGIVALRKEMVRRRSLALGNTGCVPDDLVITRGLSARPLGYGGTLRQTGTRR